MNAELTPERQQMQSPQFERIACGASESFVWRVDDYPWQFSTWNCHPEFEIHLIRHSSGIAMVGDYIGNFGPGDLTIIGSWLPHDWISFRQPGSNLPGRDLVIQFDPHRILNSAVIFPELAHLSDLFDRALNGIRFTGKSAQQFAEQLERLGDSKGADRVGRFFSILEAMSDETSYEILSKARQTSLNKNDNDIIQRVIEHLKQNISEETSLAELAAVAKMTETSFSRFFGRHVGITYSEFKTRLRIGRACSLLRSSNETVANIALDCGYNNLANFNRRFLSIQGCTPREYRKKAEDPTNGGEK
ncbi:Bacillibactin transport regulator (plasmid) [Hartmannibacter diazotrophicus]|uniref:Bacillibactin transport regulator n=1 Tax=Hartmannibacter diazotrophicus TaxID=1482074 RepID=A0A2C9DDU2_9HYPH|nr:AraC family transcriptional regulator [Hartmannibacter diazotrophicus]SON58467.1 Bacillibactin transport regulator [Hartmannibacter diazotrophicus]